MKKLTSKEMGAVIRKFRAEFAETQIKRKEKFLKENEKNISDLIDEIENSDSSIIHYILTQISKSSVAEHVKNYLMKCNNVSFNTYISERDTEDFIILSQIEAKDLNDLFALLKERFSL